ncbi:uncharacterized protein HKW66_Vig0240120 [Vigna angularis]|uniref:Syntaxin 6/10/61 N-terminal domain-containing protein n=1 Tax=Phaseolus angularis TaxID=3914 RepID=A0A8T0JI19_PHAAN|nr:uncharacterized protein HKW66_Vig0240120 [Vigna angularis]
MASSFDRWEKDPFFNAVEEVQESANMMESTYRIWLHATKDVSSMWNSDEVCRDLHIALGTAKWQLEVFERAVMSNEGEQDELALFLSGKPESNSRDIEDSPMTNCSKDFHVSMDGFMIKWFFWSNA